MKPIDQATMRALEVPAPVDMPVYTENQLKVLKVLKFFEKHPHRWCSDGKGDDEGRTMCFGVAAVHLGLEHFSVFLPRFRPSTHNDRAGSLKNMMAHARRLAKLP